MRCIQRTCLNVGAVVNIVNPLNKMISKTGFPLVNLQKSFCMCMYIVTSCNNTVILTAEVVRTFPLTNCTSICLCTVLPLGLALKPQTQGTSAGSGLNYTHNQAKFRNDYTDRVLIFCRFRSVGRQFHFLLYLDSGPGGVSV